MAPDESAEPRGRRVGPAAMPPIDEWPSNWGERERRRSTGMLWLGIAVMVVAAVMAGFSGGSPGPLWSGAVLALIGLTAFV
ncbi:MAG: hypothetical protein WBA87_00120, partial [Microbacterium sp.]